MRSKFCITVVTMMIVALVAAFGPAAPAEGVTVKKCNFWKK